MDRLASLLRLMTLLLRVAGFSFALVIIAAFVPAYRASRIDVLKALQYE